MKFSTVAVAEVTVDEQLRCVQLLSLQQFALPAHGSGRHVAQEACPVIGWRRPKAPSFAAHHVLLCSESASLPSKSGHRLAERYVVFFGQR